MSRDHADRPAASTALVVCVGEADARIDDLRQRFDPVRARGVPAHLTLLYPFVPLALRSPGVLARVVTILNQFAAFDFRLARVGRFADTAFLAPQPARPFIAMSEALAQAFPDFPPYGGGHASVVPHLSVGRGGAGEVAAAVLALKRRLREGGPIHARCEAVSLLCLTRGQWHEARRFALPPPPST